MTLHQYTVNNDFATSDTSLNFEKTETGSHALIKPLNYYMASNGQWVQGELPGEILEMRIGQNPQECRLVMNGEGIDKVQLVLRHIGDVWYMIESGKNDLMKVNGISKRQALLHDNENKVIHLGGIPFIFSMVTPRQAVVDSAALTGSPEEGEFTLRCNNATEYRFKFNRTCLIGSHPLCDFYIDGEPFAGMISPIGKRLFFTALALNPSTEIKRDGLDITENVPLAPGSKITIGKQEITLRLSKELRFSQDFKFVPDAKGECMMLLELDEYGNPGKAYALPPTGRSVFIGREKALNGIQISGSIKISRKHAQAIVYDKSILLVDHQATNGTFVDKVRIKKKLVHPGSIIRLADLNFILCYVG